MLKITILISVSLLSAPSQKYGIGTIVIHKKFIHAGTPAVIHYNLSNPPDSTNINVNDSILDKRSLEGIIMPSNKKKVWPGKLPGLNYGGYYTRQGNTKRFYFFTVDELELLYTTEFKKYFKISKVSALHL